MEDIRDKHVKIAHEGLKIYCCFFNNDTECPHEDQCVFLHEDSPICRYGNSCERDNCMFKHKISVDVDDDGNDVDVDDDDEEECENEETDELVNDHTNETFVNPSQVGKVDAAIDEDEVSTYKCDLCDDYEAPTQNQIQNHRYNAHQLHCSVCSKLFPSKTQRRKHAEKEH